MKKRILSAVLTLCILLSLIPMTTVWAADDTTELQEKLNKGGTVKLQKDYVITSTLKIIKAVTLDLNGYVLKKNSDGEIIRIRDYKTFTLNDSNPTRTHTGDFSSLPAGGLIVGYSETEYNCVGVLSGLSDFIMNGGTIMNCAGVHGGGVMMMDPGGKFIMNGGTIRDCGSSQSGGGVCMAGGCIMSMNGGVIENCSSAQALDLPRSDIGVCFTSESTFYANGGVIKGAVYDNSITGYISTIDSDSATQNSCTVFYDTFRAWDTTIKAGVFYGGIVNNYKIDSPYHTVSFDLDGGSGDIPTQYFVNTNTAKALKPTDPTKDGYAFLGWYNGNTEYKFDKPVTANVSLKAKWESISVNSESELKNKIKSGLNIVKLTSDIKLTSTLDLSDKTLTIDFNGHVLEGNINIADTSSSNKSEVTLIDSNPASTHSNTSLPAGGVLKGNITLSRSNGSKSILNADGGSVTGSLNLHSYAAKVYTSNNNKTTTSFYGNVNVSVDNAEVCTGIYYKHLSENFKSCIENGEGILLTFYVDGNEYCNEVYTPSDSSVRVASTIAPVSPTKKGYTFTSWKYTNIGTTIDWPFGTYYYIFPRILNAAFTVDAYAISYDLNGGNLVENTNPTSFNVETDSFTLNNPSKNGYTFTGWSGTGLTGENNMTVTVPKGSTGNRNYVANYSMKDGYTVSFDTKGGSAVTAKTNVKWMDKVIDDILTTRVGYTFKGWKYNGIDVTDSTKYADLAENDTTSTITLTAQWEEKSYTVTFDTAGGSSISDITGLKWNDKVISKTAEPTRSGYVFNGWKYGETKVTSSTTYASLAKVDTVESITLTAQWKQGPANTLRLNGNGGLRNNSSTYSAYTNKDYYTMFTSDEYGFVREGYAFIGWNTRSDGKGDYVTKGDNVEFEIAHNGEIVVLYAQWEDITAPVISGITNGKTYCSAQTVTVSDNDGVASVMVNDKSVTPDTDGKFTLSPAEGEQKIVVTDNVGNKTEMTVTVNGGHTGGTATCKKQAECSVCGTPYGTTNPDKHTGEEKWTTKNETQHEQKWDCCGATVVTLENHEWKDGICDECGYGCTHDGGTATCINKAVCATCGNEYGEVDETNHATLTHVEAKEATTEEEGNIEYWHCEDCDKYFSDKDCENEIALADTVIEKLDNPPTSDNIVLVFIALAFISTAGVVCITKKHRYHG